MYGAKCGALAGVACQDPEKQQCCHATGKTEKNAQRKIKNVAKEIELNSIRF